MQSMFDEVSQSVGICWLTIAVLCQISSGRTHQTATWLAIIAFHSMNSIAIITNSGSVDFDAAVSLLMLVLCVYGYRQSQAPNVTNKKE
jgi:uncharacterized membrane protein (DUF441 family)